MEIKITQFNDELTNLNADICIVNEVRHDADGNFLVCDIVNKDGSVIANGVCYFYDGINKNLPFTLTKTQKTNLGI